MAQMNWKQLLSPHRLGTDMPGKITPERSPFQRDFDRIVFSGSFRRLQDKAQVFPLDDDDYVRTRLTHSLEVSAIGKKLGECAFANVKEAGLDPFEYLDYIPYGYYQYDKSIVEYAMSGDIITIQGSAFYGCENLRKVKLIW